MYIPRPSEIHREVFLSLLSQMICLNETDLRTGASALKEMTNKLGYDILKLLLVY